MTRFLRPIADRASFQYPTIREKNVLQKLSFKVTPGQKVALVGPTGCGKSSTIRLIQVC